MFAAGFTAQNALSLVIYLVIFIAILVVAYYVTKWLGKNQKFKSSGKNFEVIETYKVSNNKFLQIIRVGKEDYYIIAIGKDDISLIAKIDQENITKIDELSGNTKGFSEVFSSFVQNVKNGGITKK